MDNNLLEILKSTTEYIEDNLLENLNLDNISQNVNISKFHLLRIWKGATSTGLMEYVRRRRIALSLVDLINHNNSIEFISSKYSFGCERTYNRAFKEEFNTTPTRWIRNPCPLNILDRFNTDFMNLAGDGLIFFQSITVLPSFSIAGPEYIVDIEDNMKHQTANRYGVDFCNSYRLKVINPVNPNIYIGFTSIPENFEKHTIYRPSVQINQNSIISKGMIIKHISSHKYGVFRYIGQHSPEEISSKTLSEIWKFIYETWMPTVQFNLKEGFRFEYINLSRCSMHYCECALYYPISIL